jgi:hypothetical protein
MAMTAQRHTLRLLLLRDLHKLLWLGLSLIALSIAVGIIGFARHQVYALTFARYLYIFPLLTFPLLLSKWNSRKNMPRDFFAEDYDPDALPDRQKLFHNMIANLFYPCCACLVCVVFYIIQAKQYGGNLYWDLTNTTTNDIPFSVTSMPYSTIEEFYFSSIAVFDLASGLLFETLAKSFIACGAVLFASTLKKKLPLRILSALSLYHIPVFLYSLVYGDLGNKIFLTLPKGYLMPWRYAPPGETFVYWQTDLPHFGWCCCWELSCLFGVGGGLYT